MQQHKNILFNLRYKKVKSNYRTSWTTKLTEAGRTPVSVTDGETSDALRRSLMWTPFLASTDFLYLYAATATTQVIDSQLHVHAHNALCDTAF